MQNDKVITPKKKTREKPRKEPLRDFFTSLCQSALHVECVKEYRFHPTRLWRFDYAIPEHKIALEVEGGVWTGGRHTSPKGFLGDIEKYNAATLLGWRLFRTTPDKLVSAATVALLRSAIENSTLETAQN
jgi:hypothetical protein